MMTTVKDWRIELMHAHARLFDLLPAKPEHSFGYPNSKDGWQDILERPCNRIEHVLRADETCDHADLERIESYRAFGLPRAGDRGRQQIDGRPAGHGRMHLRRHVRRQRVCARLQRACEEVMKAGFVEL